MEIFEIAKSALGSILANRLRSFLTVLGIVIGVTSVILLVSIVTGLQTYITNQIQSLGSKQCSPLQALLHRLRGSATSLGPAAPNPFPLASPPNR